MIVNREQEGYGQESRCQAAGAPERNSVEKIKNEKAEQGERHRGDFGIHRQQEPAERNEVRTGIRSKSFSHEVGSAGVTPAAAWIGTCRRDAGAPRLRGNL